MPLAVKHIKTRLCGEALLLTQCMTWGNPLCALIIAFINSDVIYRETGEKAWLRMWLCVDPQRDPPVSKVKMLSRFTAGLCKPLFKVNFICHLCYIQRSRQRLRRRGCGYISAKKPDKYTLKTQRIKRNYNLKTFTFYSWQFRWGSCGDVSLDITKMTFVRCV